MLKPKFWLLPIGLSISCSILASIEDYYPYKVVPTASNYGNTGIIELPNARMMPEASLRFRFSASYPYEYTSLTATPFGWLEATYRYAEIKNQKYGPITYSGNQSLKDKGFDLKALIKKETYILPAVALGLRDIAGTGLFSSEYIVASKKLGHLDLTLGMGWGILGTASNISNPLSSLHEGFKDRNTDFGEGGTFSFKNWFSGNTAIFGGLEYDLPKRGIRLKLEYDTSNPDSRNIVQDVKSRFNLGLTYAFSNNLTFSSSLDRGSQFRVGFSLKGNFLNDTITKPAPRKVQKLNSELLKNIKEDKDLFYRSLNRSLREESIYIQAANLKEKEVDIAVASSRFFSMTRPIGRTARIVSALSPEEIERINIHHMNGDLEVAKVSLGRKDLDKVNEGNLSSSELLAFSKLDSKSSEPLYKDADFMPTVSFPEFNWTMSPALRHQIGGPEGFYLGQLLWQTDTYVKFRRNLYLYTSFGINIYDTFKGLNNPSSSNIPHVRSDIQDYLTEGKNNIQRMQLQYFGTPYKDVFTRFDLGYIEEMFGGIGGEIYYRPFDKNYQLSLTAHKVKQRDFNQLFSFRDYSTITGHLGLHVDLPYQMRSTLLLGKYLAGDKGATFDISRRFNSGFTLGIFASKTNLSAEEFGEGSFDKGFYVSIPTQLFYSDFKTGVISFGLHPLTKDGAAILNQRNSLSSILGDTSKSTLIRDWDNILR
ncbi:MAG: YjbH domain-containing protein [Gammaproteobacteria bacterium]